MSEIKVNKISPKQTCTQLTLGDSGDTIIIPAGATITNNGTATGFGRTGTVNWDTTAKTTGFTAVSGNGYFCNTTSSAFTVTLPATPSAGDIISIADYNGTATTNNITIGRNGSNINSLASNFTISSNYAAISFVYVDATAGWRSVDTSNTSNVTNTFIAATGGTITTCGSYKIHTFTGPGTFTVTNTGPGSSTVDYLVVAGGGGSGTANGTPGTGSNYGTGGGGAGGFRTNYPSSCAGIPVSVTSYPITVGGGGPGGPPSAPFQATPGSSSIFSTITSAGGGRGGNGGAPLTVPGASGGSGGGGGGEPSSLGGSGNTPPVSPPQGNAGGYGVCTGPTGGGGGGGATSAGSPGTSGTGGVGGNGTASLISGSSVTYAGGGGGAGGYVSAAGTQAAGGTGGGGPGGGTTGPGPISGTSGTVNTGGGAGGTQSFPATTRAGNSGGSGIVVIRYKFQ
jgi:hypothetical protein